MTASRSGKAGWELLTKSAQVWLVLWEAHGIYRHLNGKVAAMLNYRMSEPNVAFLLEQLLVSQTSTPAEMMSYARNRKLMPYKASSDAIGVFCGSNPVLVARRAFNVKVYGDGNTQHFYGEWRPFFLHPEEPQQNANHDVL